MKFHIRARKRESNSKTESFVRQAASPDELVLALQNEGYLVLSVIDSEAKKGEFLRQLGFKNQSFSQTLKKLSGSSMFEFVSGTQLSFFFIQLVALLRAGVPILRSLSVIEQGLQKGLLKKITLGTIAKISQGFSLSSTLKDYPKAFPSFWLGLIEAGEESGTLPDVLQEIQKYQESANRFKSKVASALVYPSILIGLSLVAITVFMVVVIPKFEQAFLSQGRKGRLPGITVFVMNTSRFLQANIKWIALGVFAFIAAFLYLKTKPRTKRLLDAFKLRIPLIKDFLVEIAIVRFARGLGTLVRSGIPILHALDISSRLVGNFIIEEKIVRCREDVKQGHSIAAPFAKRKVFPIFVTQLIAVGEETGSLEKFLEVIANFYEERVDATVQRISASFEPLIIVFMGGVILVLLLSMYLPIIKMATGGH